eukprot:CAMPEP_0172307700 /NCGR_PEP_ID=MMETSP1058-20130122/8496_1 /TAXON_ID=83371 /ORGANISM="Detonula confervacea, Strain CCMP 353" /LENGTH=254 /DNA_ID=CAMNT_0013019935 /DNA_START=114 /DNA_END=878 /DNA_ORIENTATION=+
MQLIRSIVLAANACSIAHAFVPSLLNAVGQTGTLVTQLHATAETEAERLLQKVRELREEVRADEDKLHSTLFQRKATQDAATDSIIAELFPTEEEDGVCALCDRLRQKRLASDMLVRVVERLHEREVAAKGLEHVESSMHQNQVTFKRVAQEDEVELARLQGLVNRLIEAAEVLDKEFIDEKSECGNVITHSDITHWGGGNIAGIIKDKAKDLGREHDEQFLNRLESFYEAAVRKHSKDEFGEDSWREGDVWSP